LDAPCNRSANTCPDVVSVNATISNTIIKTAAIKS
jgi:hypothetical protein